MSFTLEPERWYGWQMIPGYEGERCVPFCCPCRVLQVMPQKTGKGRLKLNVWVTGYAEGVNVMEPDLQIIHRSTHYLIARIRYDDPDPDRCVVISEIEFGWVEHFCPELWQAMKLPVYPLFEPGSIQPYLDEFFNNYDLWRPDLSQEVVGCCALRFDGGKRDEELEQQSPSGSTYGNLSRLHKEHFVSRPWRLHSDPLVNWGEFYWLQRSLGWSGLDREASRLMAWLFTQLHEEEPPRGYQAAAYARLYQGLRDRAKALAQEWLAHLA